MAYAIRPFTGNDSAELARLTLAAISVVGAKAYSAEQVQAWSAGHQDAQRFHQRARDGARILVATSQSGVPAAFALIEFDSESAAHLDMLYCDPEHTRRGLAGQLLEAAEQLARAENARRIYTEASELARSAFERAGYSLQHRRDFTIKHEGRDVMIHNYAMEKLLA